MSRIGRRLINIPNGVDVKVEDKLVLIKGTKGEMTQKIVSGIVVEVEGDKVKVSTRRSDKGTRAMHGTTRAHIANMVAGVSDGWDKKLELVGTGYRAEVQGGTLVLTVGYAHPVKIEAPEGITFTVEKNEVTVSGIDKELVGKVSANIRSARPPEPYQGKGIKYKDEVIRRKAGKAAKGAEGAE